MAFYKITMDFYSVIRKNETMWFEGKWVQLEDIMLNEISQAQKDKGLMFSLMWERDTIQIQAIVWKTDHTKRRSLTGEGE
jgi:hypothetical protein